MSCAWIVAALVAAYWLLPTAWAQGSGEDVHVTPRVEPMQTSNSQPADDPTLKTHTKPIKVDVNLVLVPVSIVDPENRQVTGLDKENFEVFEGKERQQIQHFSSEDAPVSLGAIFDVSGRVQPKRPIRTADTVLRGAETNCYAPASSPHDSKGKPMLAVRLLVVDDHAIVRRSVCALISHDPTLNVICETASGEDAIKKSYELQPDLVLLDIGLPGISGIETARQIRSVSPKSK